MDAATPILTVTALVVASPLLLRSVHLVAADLRRRHRRRRRVVKAT